MAIGDVFKLIIRGRQALSIRVNELAVQYLVAEPTAAKQLELANDFKQVFQPQQHTSAAWETWELRQLWGAGMTTVPLECRRDGGVVFGGPLSAPLTGAYGASDALPPQNAMVVTLVTGSIGRRKRGRWYGWGLHEDAQSAGLWSATFLSTQTPLITTFINKYKFGGTSPDYVLGVWSERTASGCRPNPTSHELENVDVPAPEAAFTPVQAFTLRGVVYNQRRRTVNVGA